MPRQPLVDERVVRRSAARRCCGRRGSGFRRTARSRARTPRRRLSSNSGNVLTNGVTARMLRRCSHWAAKSVTSARDTTVRQHAAHLRLEHGRDPSSGRPLQPPAARRPEGCSRGRTTAVTPARDRSVAALPADSAVSRSTRNRNSGSTGRFRAPPGYRLQTRASRVGAIELEQSIRIAGCHRTSKGAARDCAEDRSAHASSARAARDDS